MTTISSTEAGQHRSATVSASHAATLAEAAEAAEAEAQAAEARAVAARARVDAMRRRRAELASTGLADDTAAVEGTDPPEASNASGEGADGDEAPRLRSRWWRGPGRPRRKRFVAAAALSVLVIGALTGASGYMVWKHHSVLAQRQRSAEFAAAARQGVVSMMSLDFHTAQRDVQRILDNTTGQFRQDFQTNSADLTKTLEASKMVTKGTVTATGIESMTDTSAVVLVAAATDVTDAHDAKQQPRTWRLSVSMVEDGGQLKMSKVEFIP